MDKIKTVKIKNPDGSVSEETYTISVDAKDVDMENGKDLQDTIGDINVDRDGSIAEQLGKYKDYDSDIETLYADVNSLEAKDTDLENDIIDLQVNKINKTDIIDNLDSTRIDKVLSAKQGKILNTTLINKKDEFIYIGDSLNEISKADKYLYLFGYDKNLWTMTFIRTANTEYKIGDYIVSNDNTKVYKCTQAGVTNNSSTIDFSLASITDGTVIWTYLTDNITIWQPNYRYIEESCIYLESYVYVCNTEHVSAITDNNNLILRDNKYYKRKKTLVEKEYNPLYLTISTNIDRKVSYLGREVPTGNLLYSFDGLNFNPINDYDFPFSGQDWDFFYYNNKYYITSFTKKNGQDFSLYLTDDFINWIKIEKNIGIADFNTNIHVWFPQIFYDDITGKLWLLYSKGIGTFVDPILDYTIVDLRLYRSEIIDIENFIFGEPEEIQISNHNRYDYSIITRNNKYYLFTRRYRDINDYSHEGWIEEWESSDFNTWNCINERIATYTDWGWEGPVVTYDKINKKYYLYAARTDKNNQNKMWRSESKDLISWINRVHIPPTGEQSCQFGGIHYIDNEEILFTIDTLLASKNNNNTLIKNTQYALSQNNNKNTIYRYINNNIFKVFETEDFIYREGGASEFTIQNIYNENYEQYYNFPHRLFFLLESTCTGSITFLSGGNIVIPNQKNSITIRGQDRIIELIYIPHLSKYMINNFVKEDLLENDAEIIVLNDLATEGVINNLQLTNNALYIVRINTVLTINNTSLPANAIGKFDVYFRLEGNSSHYTKLTIKGADGIYTNNDTDFVLTSAEHGNKIVHCGRVRYNGVLNRFV